MTTYQHRHHAEDAGRAKEMGASPDKAAPQAKTTDRNSTASAAAWIIAAALVALIGEVAR